MTDTNARIKPVSDPDGDLRCASLQKVSKCKGELSSTHVLFVYTNYGVQWSLYILDTMGPTQCPDYQGVLIFQVSLCNKESLGITTKCVDYAGVLINRFHCNRLRYPLYVAQCVTIIVLEVPLLRIIL